MGLGPQYILFSYKFSTLKASVVLTFMIIYVWVSTIPSAFSRVTTTNTRKILRIYLSFLLCFSFFFPKYRFSGFRPETGGVDQLKSYYLNPFTSTVRPSVLLTNYIIRPFSTLLHFYSS